MLEQILLRILILTLVLIQLHNIFFTSHNKNTCCLTQVTNYQIFNIIITINKNSTDIYNINMSLLKLLNK